MPKDEWAKARAKDVAKRAHSPKLRGKQRSKFKNSKIPWLSAIVEAKTNDELSAVARTVKAVHRAGKMSDYRYCLLLEAAGVNDQY